jgi:colanic acid/amylovoran biosynthesis glycosyltransferase
MAKRLLFFTISYPYGVGEVWKKNELEVLVRHFPELIVIPFSFGGNFDNPKPFISSIRYEQPLFNELKLAPWYIALPIIIFNARSSIYTQEFFQQKVFKKWTKFRAWLRSAYIMEKLYRHPKIKEYLIEAQEDTIAYFFWGRRSSEVVPLLNNPKVKTACRFHGFDLYAYRYKSNYIAFQSQQLEKLDLILPISEDGARYFSERHSGANNKIKVSRLGATPPQGQSVASSDGIFRIASCSSLIQLKRITLIAQALQKIEDRPIEWTHIGDGPEMKRLQSIISTLPSNIQVKLPGWIPAAAVQQYYTDHPVDLFINVSTTEGVPVSIMEAMAAGIPVLATDVGGTSEIVNEQNGRLLNPDLTTDELALAIHEFSALAENRRDKMRQQAHETFSTYYNAQVNAEKLAAELKKL